MDCAQKDMFGSIELIEAIARYRAWSATNLTATFEFQTLSVKEIRDILHQSFGASAFAEDPQVIKGWRLKGEGEVQMRQPYSRVGMVKARVAGEQKERHAKRGPDGRFVAISNTRERSISYADLPATPRRLVAFWQKKGVLPVELDGCPLELRETRKHGDYRNGRLALCAPTHVDKNRHSAYLSIRPRLLQQTKIPLVTANGILYDLVWGLSLYQVAAKLGRGYYKDSAKVVWNQPISLLHRHMQRVIAYAEAKRLKQVTLGGVGKEVEADAAKLGRDRKNAVGHLSYNKGYVQFLGERGGDVIIDVFANPGGGVEKLSQVKAVLDGNLAKGTVLHTDRARAYVAYAMDNPQLDLVHCRVNHSEAEKEGFVWKLFMDREDGPEFADNEDGETILTVSTQLADGYIANLKEWLSARGGVQRAHLRGYLKEKQWRSNWGSKKDLYAHFLECWAEMERDIRAGIVTMGDVDDCITWDYSGYFRGRDNESGSSHEGDARSDPYWICPGCGKVIAGRHAPQYKFTHKRKCKYYMEHPPRTYNHESSRCLCCVADGNGGKIRFSEWMQGSPGPAVKKRKVESGEERRRGRKTPRGMAF